MHMSTACSQLLQLSAIPGFGLKSFYQLHEQYGSVAAIFSCDVSGFSVPGLNQSMVSALAEAASGRPSDDFVAYKDRVQRWLEAGSDRYICCLEDPDYPSLLKEIYRPPPILYLEGKRSALEVPSIAIVGSRKPSLQGLRHAQKMAYELSGRGLCVTSGLALGIDAAAHRSAIKSQGLTCAVMATGLDTIYPKQHRALAEDIVKQGVIVSEMKLGTPPRPGHFPRRNRLISGLSQGVLVVEAGLASGSLITARYALEQNRDVFAVPGSIDNLVAQGCNLLIKQGAKLVDCVDDVLEDFGLSSGPMAIIDNVGSKADCQLSETERKVMSLLGAGALDFDHLQVEARVLSKDLLETLFSLEIKGLLSQVPGGYERLK